MRSALLRIQTHEGEGDSVTAPTPRSRDTEYIAFQIQCDRAGDEPAVRAIGERMENSLGPSTAKDVQNRFRISRTRWGQFVDSTVALFTTGSRAENRAVLGDEQPSRRILHVRETALKVVNHGFPRSSCGARKFENDPIIRSSAEKG